jgi:hypothetical protein
MEWLKAFDSDVAREFYVLPLQIWEHKWVRKIDEKSFWDFLRSLSYINSLSLDERQVLRLLREKLTIDDEESCRRDH